MKEKTANILKAIGSVIGIGMLTMASLATSDNDPDNIGKDYPMPNLKEDYHPHKKGVDDNE